MKIKHIILIGLLCTIGLSYGQGVVVHNILLENKFKDDITKTIVRSYNNNSISYIEGNIKHCFVAMSYSPTDTGHNFNLVETKEIQIDNSYIVNDFKIVDSSYVYLCGKHIKNNDSLGFIGFFELSEFLAGNDNTVIEVNDDFRQKINNYTVKVSNLIKMEVFFGGGDKFHVVAIGETSDSRSCIVEMKTDMVGDINGTYQLGISTCKTERINDIAVTDNYVVTVGTCYLAPYSTIRRYLKHDIFSNIVNHDTAYLYPPNESISATEYLADDINNILITPIQGDTIAIASYCYNSANQTPHLNGTLIRIYDVSSTPEPSMLASISINQNYYNGDWKLKEFQYNPVFKTFELLQNMEDAPNSLVNLFSKIYLNNVFLVESAKYYDIEFSSFDNYFSSQYNILSGYDINNPFKWIFVGDKIDNPNFCNGYNLNQTISFKSLYTAKIVTDNFSENKDDLSFYKKHLFNFKSKHMDLLCIKHQ